MFETGTTLRGSSGRADHRTSPLRRLGSGVRRPGLASHEDALARSWESEQLPDLSDLPPIMVAAFLHRIDPDKLPVRDQVWCSRRSVCGKPPSRIGRRHRRHLRWTPPWEQDTPGSAFQHPLGVRVRRDRRPLLTCHGAEQRADLAISLPTSTTLLEMLREGRVDLYRVRVVVEGSDTRVRGASRPRRVDLPISPSSPR